MMGKLVLAVKGVYFDQIADGVKSDEYRLANAYWEKRLVGRSFDTVEITKGYPAASDLSRRIERPWRGYSRQTITHPHFGSEPVEVFAIHLTPQAQS